MGEIATPETIGSDLAACKNAFDQIGIPWVIIDGVALGFAKIKKILPGDTDLDFGVFVELSNKQWKNLIMSLAKNQFKIKARNSGKGDFKTLHRKSKSNMWLYHKNGEFYESFPFSTPGLKFVEKVKWYDNPQIVDFLGKNYLVPNYLEDYIECHYGKKWREKTYTHGEWRVEKFGTLDQSVKIGQKIWLESRCGKNGDLWPKIMNIGDEL